MSEGLAIRGGYVLTSAGWRRGGVLIEGGRIMRVGRVRAPHIVDARGACVMPGLIDVQVNGALGKSFSSASSEEMRTVATGLARLGVTGFLAALVSLPTEKGVDALEKMREAVDGGLSGARLLGAHLEGPFLNPERAGAHKPEHIHPATLVEFSQLAGAGRGMARMMTIAPEVKGAISLIAAGVKRGMVMSLGHSNATAAQVEEAIGVGASTVTHLFNAMAPFHHRDDSFLTAALLDDRLTCACIYDRHHISRRAMMLALRCKPRDRIALVSDATAALEAPDGSFEVDGVRFSVAGGAVTVSGTKTLGGSASSLLEGVRNLVEDVGLSFEEAWAMGSSVPARILGLERSKGMIAPGFDADLVVIDRQWRVLATLVGGIVAYGNLD